MHDIIFPGCRVSSSHRVRNGADSNRVNVRARGFPAPPPASPPSPAETRLLPKNSSKVSEKVAFRSCGWESLMKSVTLGNVTMSHRTREARRMPSLSHSTMIGLPRA
ncbi:hypothetical protein EVAR_98160_1 [Eumeta japonica]|uniref:Uncharacterized protein n=1 Tax=Eumeta variegata TaxID=151549 RepID=A0A4C1YKB3_EUMVA|nr:hypothetical protein EVAR_98160_1 [Eumeta japonica]